MGGWQEILGVVTLTVAMSGVAVAQDGRFAPPEEYQPHDILYALNVPTAESLHAELRAEVGAVEGKELWPGRIFKMVVAEDVDLFEAIDALRADPRVRYAEPNGVVHAVDTIPDDPDYGLQWGWSMISAPAAWDVQTDASDVLIAVIDTGIQYDHPDLAANVWTNPGEIPGNGVDDDGNGFIDDVHGYDFLNGDSDPWDDNFHGTHCSGTVGAVTDNTTGVAGTCWNATIAAIKMLDSSGSGTWEAAVESVNYAVTIGAQLSSNSWGGTGGSDALRDAICLAADSDHLFVAAAGNNGMDNDSFLFYPASYDCENIISVAATDSSDNMAGFSNYGVKTVDLGAPGVDIYSTTVGSSYRYLNGTSMACPHVAGVATMLFSYSGTTDWAQVKQWIMDSVDLTPAMTGRCQSDGRLNMDRALAMVNRPSLPSSGLLLSVQDADTLGGLSVDPGDLVHLDLGTGAYTMILDGEDVTGGGQQLDAAALLGDGTLLLSYADDGLSLSGAGTVDDEDVVRYVPLAWGAATDGFFRSYFDGSDVGLDTDSEDISACSIDAEGDLHLSTKGKYDVGFVGKNEDILEFSADCLGSTTAGSFTLLIHGRSTDLRLGKKGEQINAYHFQTATGEPWFSTGGDFRVPVNQKGQNDDILVLAPTLFGNPTEGTLTIIFDGAAYDLDPNNIDALIVLD